MPRAYSCICIAVQSAMRICPRYSTLWEHRYALVMPPYPCASRLWWNGHTLCANRCYIASAYVVTRYGRCAHGRRDGKHILWRQDSRIRSAAREPHSWSTGSQILRCVAWFWTFRCALGSCGAMGSRCRSWTGLRVDFPWRAPARGTQGCTLGDAPRGRGTCAGCRCIERCARTHRDKLRPPRKLGPAPPCRSTPPVLAIWSRL